ncbi:response regulator [Arcobacter sp. FWKO B]|uniref:response regulator n=1 Tax=Arcobacter sp. FWKO B TaxID=2593672 RepID=UPI001908B026|nr:response regulator [Arcobacter sp. FWKO B]
MLKVLIVDDSLIIRKKISSILQKLGHEVAGDAQNGTEAIKKYTELKPDLVTMDITMPDMDGITAVTHIIKQNHDAKIIMITSHGQEDMVIKSIQAGAVGYMLKPITEEKLASAIGEVFIEYAVEIDEELE